MKRLIAFVLVCGFVVVSGCTTYVHRRPVPDVNGHVGYESTKARSWLSKLDLEQLKTEVEDGNYRRKVGVDKAGVAPDAAAIKAVTDAGKELAKQAFEFGKEVGKKSVGVP